MSLSPSIAVSLTAMADPTVGVQMPGGEIPPVATVIIHEPDCTSLLLAGTDPASFDRLADALREASRRLRAAKVALIEGLPA